MDTLRRRLPSPGALFLFEAAARHQNFTRAAEEMNVTQPAVSRALALLERHLGVRLFQRGKIGARLTEDGRILQEAVSAGFAQIEQGLDRLEMRRSGRTQVALSVSTAFTAHWLMPRISRCQAAFPELDLRFQLIAGPIGGPVGDVDLAMRFVAPGEVTGRFVMHEAYLPVCAPGYLARAGGRCTVIELEREGVRTAHPAQDRWAGREIEARLAFPDYAVVVQAALTGQGIAPGWLNVVAYWMNQGQLVPAAQVLTLPGRVCQIVGRNDSAKAALVAAVADWLVDELRADLDVLDAAHPELGISGLLRQP